MNKLRQLLARPYMVTNSKGKKYYLSMKKVALRGGKLHPIYFFVAKRFIQPNQGDLQHKLPIGFYVKENPRNGFMAVVRGNAVDEGSQDD